MTDAPAPITVDLPLSVAVKELTGFEVIAIEDYFRADFGAMGGMKTLIGAIWVFGNRGDAKLSWAAVKAMSLGQMEGVFAPEPEHPDTDLGKES